MAIYTSRYQNKELCSDKYTIVGITRGKPKFHLDYILSGNIMDIAPPGWLFNEYNRKIFEEKYRQNIERIGISKISMQLAMYERYEKDVVLCCYEDVRKPNEWCHRLVFADWWLEKTGEKIIELVDNSSIVIKKARADKEKEIKKSETGEPPEAPYIQITFT